MKKKTLLTTFQIGFNTKDSFNFTDRWDGWTDRQIFLFTY